MFNLKITSLLEAQELLQSNWADCAISLVCPGTPLKSLYDKHKVLFVHDIPFEKKGFIAPQIEHIQDVLTFTEGLKSGDRLLVHCYAGVSRSTSMAIGILIHHGMGWKEAFDFVATVRPFMLPNKRIMQLLDGNFNLGGKLVEYSTMRTSDSASQMLVGLRSMPQQTPSASEGNWMQRMREIIDPNERK